MKLFKIKLRKKKILRQKELSPRHTVDYNAYKIRKEYPLNEYGYFGKKGKGKSRVIYSDNHDKDAKHFYSKIGKGGKRELLLNGHGEQRTMKDGGKVIYRKITSTPNSPAISLGNMKGRVKNQKIHFVNRENRQ